MRNPSMNRIRARAIFLLLLITVLESGLAEGKTRRNPVANYLRGAELQCETDEQRANIVTALNDALTLPGDSLAARRYKNYQGQEGQWDLPTLIYRHFVPDHLWATLGTTHFYRDVKSREAQEVIRQILQRIQKEK
jgi:hypothetical protein